MGFFAFENDWTTYMMECTRLAFLQRMIVVAQIDCMFWNHVVSYTARN